MIISRKELETAIDECLAQPNSYQKCEKLANVLTIYDHYYGLAQPINRERDNIIDVFDYTSDNELSGLINGKSVNTVLDIFSELLDVVKLLHPKLYDSLIVKLNNI